MKNGSPESNTFSPVRIRARTSPSPPPPVPGPAKAAGFQRSRAYTLTEVAVVLLIAALMFSMVAPVYLNMVETAKSDDVLQELTDMSHEIDDFYKKHGHYPDSLEEVISPVPLDPWGRPYQYLRIDGGTGKGMGQLRKDKNLVPINTDFDLYSMGPDGESVPPLTASTSKDDIIRGRDGKFFGVAADY